MIEFIKKWLLEREHAQLVKELEETKGDYAHASQSLAELKKEKRALNEQLEDLRLKKRLGEEEIAHTIRMREERQKLELDTERLAMERARDTAIQTVKSEYTAKYEGHLVKQAEKAEKLMADILERLPNITAELKVRRGE